MTGSRRCSVRVIGRMWCRWQDWINVASVADGLAVGLYLDLRDLCGARARVVESRGCPAPVGRGRRG